MSKKRHENKTGSSVFAIVNAATGPRAETLRRTIEWNEIRSKSAARSGDKAAVERHAKNRGEAMTELLAIAVAQKSETA